MESATTPQCVDYVNGGPAFEGDASSTWAPLAWYEGGRIAAVRCQVGQGRAVLCGSHPELLPDWLTPATQTSVLVASGLAGEDASSLALHAASVQAALCEGRRERWLFWVSLLEATGLGKYLRDDS